MVKVRRKQHYLHSVQWITSILSKYQGFLGVNTENYNWFQPLHPQPRKTEILKLRKTKAAASEYHISLLKINLQYSSRNLKAMKIKQILPLNIYASGFIITQLACQS